MQSFCRSADLSEVEIQSERETGSGHRSCGEQVAGSLFAFPDDDCSVGVTRCQEALVVSEGDIKYCGRVAGKGVYTGVVCVPFHVKEVHAHVLASRH